MSGASQMAENDGKKARTQYDKVGKYQYLLQKVEAMRRDVRDIKAFMRLLSKGLEPQLVFDTDYIQDIACRDEKDREILDTLKGAGEYGMLPRDIANVLGDKHFTRFHVSRRLVQMNKRLDKVLGQRVAEKRGKNWALTSFMRSAWDEEDNAEKE